MTASLNVFDGMFNVNNDVLDFVAGDSADVVTETLETIFSYIDEGFFDYN